MAATQAKQKAGKEQRAGSPAQRSQHLQLDHSLLSGPCRMLGSLPGLYPTVLNTGNVSGQGRLCSPTPLLESSPCAPSGSHGNPCSGNTGRPSHTLLVQRMHPLVGRFA